MFVFSFKASSVKILCALCLCIAAGAFVISLMPEAGYAVNVNKTEVSSELDKINVKSKDGRSDYLEALGFGVDNKNESKVSTTVPETFDAATEQYNNMQKMQGFDLEKYKGKKVDSYTYGVTSFPDGTKIGDRKYLVTLIVHNGKVIAADMCCEETGEVMGVIKTA